MKKTLLSLLCALFAAIGAMAQSYTDDLVVTINGMSSQPQQTTVLFTDNGNGTCNFSLPNFCLVDGEDVMPVGNISIEGIALTKGSISTFEYNDNLLITDGDDSQPMWLGPMLGEIPLKLTGKVTADKIFVAIDIDMQESIGQIVMVTFGDDNFPTGPVAGEKSGIYLRGSFNGWGTSDEAEFLTTSVAGVYEIKNLTLANGSDGFKVADAAWGDINFGGNGKLTVGQPYTLVAGGGNIKFATDNEYVCSVITLDMNAKTLTVEGEEGGKLVENVDFVSLAGTAFIGAEWDPASDAGRMSETTDSFFGGVFRTFEWIKAAVPAGDHQFKFTANGSWDINWGSSEFDWNKEVQLVRGGENVAFSLAETADIKIELTIYPADLSNAKFVVKNLTLEGIETIVAEGSVNLYDLQGRRVYPELLSKGRAQNGVVIGAGRKMIRK